MTNAVSYGCMYQMGYRDAVEDVCQILQDLRISADDLLGTPAGTNGLSVDAAIRQTIPEFQPAERS